MHRGELSLRTTQVGNTAVLTLAGEIDMLTAPSLADAVTRLLATEPATLALDFGEVTFCDSTGVAVLVRASQRAAAAGCELRVRRARLAIRHVLEISGVDQVITVEPAAQG